MAPFTDVEVKREHLEVALPIVGSGTCNEPMEIDNNIPAS